MEILGGLSIIDRNGRIIYINDTYATKMNINKREALGKPIKSVVKDTKLVEILKTGETILGEPYDRGHVNFIVNRFPIFKDGAIIGVMGHSTFNDITEIESLKIKLDRTSNELNYYKEKSKPLMTAKYSFDHIISRDRTIAKLKEHVMTIAQTKSTVLITGESGTQFTI
jgi:transcriptional regulator with PAS, ATPase and Fis domain